MFSAATQIILSLKDSNAQLQTMLRFLIVAAAVNRGSFINEIQIFYE